ncbi:MAG: acyl-CoA dehydrogenase [Mycobacteriaceae bacterium]|nr:acyl-CoA dehydrogenase [Mycobacteriaceae bacterium]
MDIGPGSDQLGLRDNVREVLAADCPPDLTRQAMTDPQCWHGLWKSVVDLGWPALAGGEFGAIDLAVVLEECGAALAPIPMLSSVGLAAGALRAAGPAVETAVCEIVDGTVATLAVQSADRRLPTVPMRLTDGRVHGRAVHVPELSRAELVVTLAASEDGATVAAVVREGVRVEETESADPSRPLADIEIDAVPELTAPVDTRAAIALPLLAAAADLVGVAAGALRRAVDHANSRTQFGKPIGAFQGVKHALADNHVSLERARSLTYAAAARLDNGPAADAWTAAAMAKAAAGDAAVNCARTAVQVHGAVAQTWEHDMHLYVRRAWQGAALLGDSRALYGEVGRQFVGGEPR